MSNIILEVKRLQKLAGILEEQTRTISYTGIVLTKADSDNLVSALKEKIPKGWEIVAHHATVNMGSFKGDRNLLNSEKTLTVNSFAIDNKVCAVSVSMPPEIPSKNINPHITIAVNRVEGGKPFDSNKLDWAKAEQIQSMKLDGKLVEVAQGENLFAENYPVTEN